jgi:hypothetical protein
MRKRLKVGVVIVIFDEETRTPIKEGEEEIEFPAAPFLHEKTFRDACLRAFIKAGGENLHQ